MLVVELPTGFLDLIFIAVEAFEFIRLLVSVLAESYVDDVADVRIVAIYLREDKRWLYVCMYVYVICKLKYV